MTIRIACLHTAHSNVAVFEAARLGLDQAILLQHTVLPDLLAATEQVGGLTPCIERSTIEALRDRRAGADAVLLTCSTLGPAVNGLEAEDDVPVLRVDAALAQEATRDGGKVVVLVTAQTTIEPTQRLFEAAAGPAGAVVAVRLVAGAWPAFKSGEQDRYLRLIAEAADEAVRGGAARVALGQASMAAAAQFTTHGTVPLTSPTAGLRAAIAAA